MRPTDHSPQTKREEEEEGRGGLNDESSERARTGPDAPRYPGGEVGRESCRLGRKEGGGDLRPAEAGSFARPRAQSSWTVGGGSPLGSHAQ